MASSPSISVLISITLVKMALSTWTISSGLFQNDEMAVGSYNGKILLLGGYKNERQITEYDLDTKQFTYIGDTALPSDIEGGDGQFWTQQQHIIYMVYSTQLLTYNMMTDKYTTNWMEITTDVSYASCIASSPQHLFITGGHRSYTLSSSELHILSLETHEMVNNPPFMKQVREAHACIVHNNYLWVFGGYDTALGVYLKVNERADITDITQIIWNDIDELSIGLDLLRAAAWKNTLYIIGGDTGGSTQQDIVHVIDANTGSIAILSDNLGYESVYSSPIIVDAVLYVFGGLHTIGGSLTNKWAYYPLLTLQPTLSTSTLDNPTPSPSNKPTLQPTLSTLIDNPTLSPTPSPSNYPTLKPTLPPIITCGQHLTGSYNDQTLPFNVRLPYDGQLTFDASQSNFGIQTLTVVFGVTPIAADTDYDGILTISNQIAADYTFSIQASPGVHGIFDVTVSCESNNPTLSPTEDPTFTPTAHPTPSPTAIPTAAPTQQPTARPTETPIKAGSPTKDPTPATPLPTRSPTLYPTIAPTDTKDPTNAPSTNPTKSPLTPSPTHPETITCGERVTGSYNNAPIQFPVHIPYRGDLTFDASRSKTLSITSLTAMFGITPIAFDDDLDDIITLKDTVSGTYTFTIIAQNKPSQMYDVRVFCMNASPTSTTTYPTRMPTAITVLSTDTNSIGSSINIISTTSYIKNNVIKGVLLNGIGVMLYVAVAATLVVLCIVIAIFCFKKRRQKRRNTHRMMNYGNPQQQIVAMCSVDTTVNVANEVEAQLLLNWLKDKVNLPQYFNLFIANGYDSLKTVKRIQFKQELKDIGIGKQGHVAMIMHEIRNLQNPEGGDEHDPLSTDTDKSSKTDTDTGIKKTGLQKMEEGEIGLSMSSSNCSSMYQTYKESLVVTKMYPDIPVLEEGVEMRRCEDCGVMTSSGRVYDDDGQFYCNACWNYYQ